MILMQAKYHSPIKIPFDDENNDDSRSIYQQNHHSQDHQDKYD